MVGCEVLRTGLEWALTRCRAALHSATAFRTALPLLPAGLRPVNNGGSGGSGDGDDNDGER